MGSSLLWKNTGLFSITAGELTIQCSTVEFKSVLTKNSGTVFAMEVPVGNTSFSGSEADGDCTSSTSGPVKMTVNSKLCVESVKSTDTVTITGCGTNVTFTWTFTVFGPCKYKTASITGTFVTQADAAVTLKDQLYEREEGGLFCPSEWVTELALGLTTTNETTLSLS